ncbi:MAG: sigma-54-dependent Fis family transcriptional regulator [Verrucomicrobia bacterium]|nr:sigma-54-dependent Fis family transcriptional regulator [Verrucomicrobiota bacterium]MBI3869265.1 sigma-54-dependent Fis family transcriptional regulator [Verrucomicrobiota bacterium]
MDKLLLIDDEADVRYSFRRIFESAEVRVFEAPSGEAGLEQVPEIHPDLVVMDIRMAGIGGLETLRKLRALDPKLPVIMMTAYGSTQTVIEAMKLGAYDYLNKPFDIPRLKEVIGAAMKASRDMRKVVSYQPLLESEDYDLGIVGRSEPMQGVFKLIGQLAATDATALITGESGTGKELVARAIYHHSRRGSQPFLAINCAAIPENLLESELFGHERGAFTGATHQRIGKFEQCHNGTLFLDEIGDMPLQTQTKILRVLQSGGFERVGGNQPIQVNVRVIAATNRPLERAVAERQFREDLFFRLNVVRIHLPALRERGGDVRLLTDYFLKKLPQRQGLASKAISEEALRFFESHSWPGNVRELENALQRAMVVCKGDVILPADLPPEVYGGVAVGTALGGPHASEHPSASPPVSGGGAAAGAHLSAPTAEDVPALARALFQLARAQSKLKVIPAVERELIIQALKETQGNQVQAAKLLGITRATLRKRIDKFGIRTEIAIQ